MDWGIPKVLLSNRDKKFLSELWTGLLKSLGVQSVYSTAYHPQTDGQSERTNQTAEIALRFFLAGLDSPKEWPNVLPRLQASLNNATSATTGKSPNEVVYGFKPYGVVDLVSPPKVLGSATHTRIEAHDAVAFANMSMKRSYDRKHHPMYLRVGDYAHIRLHRGYGIPTTRMLGRKLSQQFAGPFRIIERVGRLAYRLDTPTHWRIHPVFSIAQLEPAPDPVDDPFSRPRPDQPPQIHVEGDNEYWKSYEIERLLDRRVTKKGQGQSVEYLVRWKGWGPEWDQWMALKNLGNAQEMVDDYNKEMVEGYRKMGMPGRDAALTTQPASQGTPTTAVVTQSGSGVARPATRAAPTTTTATHSSSSATQPTPRRRGRPSKGRS